jgi:hypothetical protein
MVAEEESTVVRDLTNVFHSASLPKSQAFPSLCENSRLVYTQVTAFHEKCL